MNRADGLALTHHSLCGAIGVQDLTVRGCESHSASQRIECLRHAFALQRVRVERMGDESRAP